MAVRALVTEFDERLMIEAARRDPRQFAQLYENNFERVYGFIASRVHDRSAAEDLTAEVFQKALAKLESYEWRGLPFSAWLLRLATNVVHDHWRAPVRREVADDTPEIGRDDGIERRAWLSQLLDRLPDDQRTVVTRRFLDGRSIAEIAAEMKRSEGAIKQLQFRGLQTLRAQMKETR